MNRPLPLFDRISHARKILGLAESATLVEIETKSKDLLKRWHPDCCREDPETCAAMTREILAATQLIKEYCRNYHYDFRQEEVEKYLTPEEWWHKRFGNDPSWGNGRGSSNRGNIS